MSAPHKNIHSCKNMNSKIELHNFEGKQSGLFLQDLKVFAAESFVIEKIRKTKELSELKSWKWMKKVGLTLTSMLQKLWP